MPHELLDDVQLKNFQYCNKIEPHYIPKIDVVEYKGVNLIYLKCVAGDAGPYQAPVDVYSKKESGKEQNRIMKYWIRPASLTTEAKQDELAELLKNLLQHLLWIVSIIGHLWNIYAEDTWGILLGKATVH